MYTHLRNTHTRTKTHLVAPQPFPSPYTYVFNSPHPSRAIAYSRHAHTTTHTLKRKQTYIHRIYIYIHIHHTIVGWDICMGWSRVRLHDFYECNVIGIEKRILNGCVDCVGLFCRVVWSHFVSCVLCCLNMCFIIINYKLEYAQ